MKKFIVLFLVGSVLAGSYWSSRKSYDDYSSGERGHGYGYGNGHGHGHGSGHGHGNGNGGNNNRGCERGWLRLDRPSGGWCVKAFEGALSNDNAESMCQQKGATLSSLQNNHELLRIAASALPVVSPRQTGYFWIGARRTSACMRSKLTSHCNEHNSFVWTDGSASGTDGFQWNGNQPDNSHGLIQACAVLYTASPAVTTGWTKNRLDDVDCYGHPEQQNVASRANGFGYICGKRPIGRK